MVERFEDAWLVGISAATLKERVGTWDAAFKMHMGPQVVEDKATMTYKMMGDFWVVGDYEGRMPDGPFHGHEMSTYDPAAKEFVSYWVDSMSPTLTEMRGTWDAPTKTMSMKSKQPDPNTGKKTTSKTVMKDKDTWIGERASKINRPGAYAGTASC